MHLCNLYIYTGNYYISEKQARFLQREWQTQDWITTNNYIHMSQSISLFVSPWHKLISPFVLLYLAYLRGGGGGWAGYTSQC